MGYKNRYGNQQKQMAYMNACDCLFYGYGKTAWNPCGLTGTEADEIWYRALKDIIR